MRQATLFTINQHEVMATDRFSYFVQNAMPNLEEALLAGPDVLVTSTETKIDLPIHHIRKVEYGRQTDNYIAITPELQEILEAPFERRVVELKREVLEAEAFAKATYGKLQAADELITAYNNLPWYKRIFYKVQYPLPNYHD